MKKAGLDRGVPLPHPEAVRALACRHGGWVDDAVAARVVDRIVAPDDAAEPSDLVVLTALRHRDAVLRQPGVVLCDAALATQVPAGRRWAHPHVMWVAAKVLGSGPEATAEGQRRGVVAEGAQVAPDAEIRAGAVVLGGARIGSRSVVGEGAVIYGRVRIGSRVIVGPLSVVGRPGFGFAAGPGGELVRIPQLGGVVVEDDTEIGALCTVDAGTFGPTRLGRGVKLDAHVHIGHNVQIESGTMVAAQAGFAGSAVVGVGVLVGGQAGIADHVHVGSGARIGAKSGVIGDVPSGATVAGFPAVSRMRWLRAMAKLLGPRRDGRER